VYNLCEVVLKVTNPQVQHLLILNLVILLFSIQKVISLINDLIKKLINWTIK
jgi:hypothetical protein